MPCNPSRLILPVALLSYLAVCPLSAFATNYEIDFKVTNQKAYSSLDLSINYAAAPGDFTGSGEGAACTSTLNALLAFNNCTSTSLPGCPQTDVLKSAIAALPDLQGPVVLFTCTMSAASLPSANQFVISVLDWTAPHTTPPTVVVSRIAAQ